MRITALVLASALVGAACAPTEPAEPPAFTEPAADLEALPAVDLVALRDTDTAVNTASISGPTVINFWASWCGPCAKEMPDFDRVAADVQGRVAFVGVNRLDPLGDATALAEETGVTYNLVVDDADTLFTELGLVPMPTTLFVNENGIIAKRLGIMTEQQLRDALITHYNVG